MQATHINFICPMRFDNFPLDTQTCKFQVRIKNNSPLICYRHQVCVQVGSYSYDMAKMVFTQTNKVQGYVKTAHSVVLDYAVKPRIPIFLKIMIHLYQVFYIRFTFFAHWNYWNRNIDHGMLHMFQVNVMELSADDQVLGYGELGNFSVAGFEMVLNR